MVGRYKVITLCGSTRFKDEFIETQKRLSLQGNIVISVGLFGHSGDKEVWQDGVKEMLDDMHKRKIDMADSIYVINVGGYIGSSTRSEIEYAIAHGKTVEYLDSIMSRVTLPGSIFLGIISILPAIAMIFGINNQFASFYGGTSLLILVGVVLDTLQQVESYLLMRHYDGLMKTGRLSGRSGM